MLLMSHVAMPTLDKPAETTMIGRWFRLRLAGLLLATASIASVLYENQARPFTWFLLAVTAIAWPLFARDLGSRSRDAQASELRSLLVDSALGGFWIAVMQFNVLPSVAISVLVICDKIVAGGRVLTIRGLIVQVAACVLTMAVHGFAFSPFTTMAEILATLPLLILYPLALGTTMRTQSRRLGESMRVPAPLEAARKQDTNLSAA
jgi:diguanylate cyclase